MLLESMHHASLAFGIFDGSIFKPPSGDEISHIILRWLHFVAGMGWACQAVPVTTSILSVPYLAVRF